MLNFIFAYITDRAFLSFVILLSANADLAFISIHFALVYLLTFISFFILLFLSILSDIYFVSLLNHASKIDTCC